VSVKYLDHKWRGSYPPTAVARLDDRHSHWAADPASQRRACTWPSREGNQYGQWHGHAGSGRVRKECPVADVSVCALTWEIFQEIAVIIPGGRSPASRFASSPKQDPASAMDESTAEWVGGGAAGPAGCCPGPSHISPAPRQPALPYQKRRSAPAIHP